MTDTDMTFQTWCIGRHTVEVPAHFVPVDSFGSIAGMKVMQLGPGDDRALEALVAQRMRDLAEEKGEDDDRGPKLLRATYRDGEIHVIAHEPDLGQQAGTGYVWTEEAYVLRGGFMMRVEQALTEDETEGPRAQMLDLARKIVPHRRDLVPSGPGACLPEALALVPQTSEVHGMSFVPKDNPGHAVGLDITILYRTAEDPPFDREMPRGPNARRIDFAGLSGVYVEDDAKNGPSRLALVRRPAAGGRPAVQIEIHYFDEIYYYGGRPVFAGPTEAEQQARILFDHVLKGIRERGAER